MVQPPYPHSAQQMMTNADYENEMTKLRVELAATKGTLNDILRNESEYQSENPEYRDYITLNEKMDRVERKLDDVLSFVDEVKKATEAFANNGGVFSGLLRSILPK